MKYHQTPIYRPPLIDSDDALPIPIPKGICDIELGEDYFEACKPAMAHRTQQKIVRYARIWAARMGNQFEFMTLPEKFGVRISRIR